MKLAYFFDGTGNNLTNSSKDPNKFGNITNIAKLFNNCTLVSTDKLYVEGIGTLDNKEDSDIAKATGSTPFPGYSYIDKLNKALSHFESKLKTEKEIEVFVYGFSRGATLARDFSKQIIRNNNVKITFLGIYDTVVSLATRQPDLFFTDTELVKIDEIVHLCAIHEARKYFPLTSVLNKNISNELIKIENTYTSKIKEIFVPGAHADVGGGYLEDDENLFLNEIRSSCDSLLKDLDIIKNTVKDNFSCAPNLIWNTLLTTEKEDSKYNVSCVSADWFGSNLVSQRNNVLTEMSNVYFHLFLKYTNDKVTIFNTSINSIDNQYLNELLDSIYEYLKTGIPKKGVCVSDYKKYKNYIHISSNYGTVDAKNANKYLNTFDPTLLSIEIENLKLNKSINNVEILRKDQIYQSLGINPLYVNQPVNNEWHREVLYK